jgi:hypothetical protein
MARPMATRWRWPPDRSLGLRSSRCSICRIFAAFAHQAVDFGLRHLGQLQAERHVVVQIHVRVQRVRLEHHGDAAPDGPAPAGRHRRDPRPLGARDRARRAALRRRAACDDYAGIVRCCTPTWPRHAGVRINHAAFALANPISGDLMRMTNRDWQFSTDEVRRTLGLSTLLIVNDFTALAMALPGFKPDDLLQVGGGKPQPHAVASACSARARAWACRA